MQADRRRERPPPAVALGDGLGAGRGPAREEGAGPRRGLVVFVFSVFFFVVGKVVVAVPFVVVAGGKVIFFFSCSAFGAVVGVGVVVGRVLVTRTALVALTSSASAGRVRPRTFNAAGAAAPGALYKTPPSRAALPPGPGCLGGGFLRRRSPRGGGRRR